MASFAELMGSKASKVETPAPGVRSPGDKPAPDFSAPPAKASNELIKDLISESIREVKIEAVFKKVLMMVSFAPGVLPGDAIEGLRALDPEVKFRDDFPKSGGGAFGKRDTKVARALTIIADVRETGKFITIIATTGADDLSVSVGKKGADEWFGKVSSLGKLSDRNLEKLRAAFDGKKLATITLGGSEQFGVKYWTTDDGKAFLEEMVPEPPAPVEGGAKE